MAFLVPQVVQTLLLRVSSDVARDASIIVGTPSSSIPTVEGSCNIARDASIIVATPSSSNPNVEGSSDVARDASIIVVPLVVQSLLLRVAQMLQGMLVLLVYTPGSEGKDSHAFETPISKDKDYLYVPDTPAMRSTGGVRGGTTPFLTSAKQLESLISGINRTSRCRAPGCDGELRFKNVDLTGKGGDGKANFFCSGRCGTRDICLPFSEYHERSKQTNVSFALQVAFISSGANYAQYETVLGSMGMHPVSDYKFYETIQLMEGPTTELLDEQCRIAKEETGPFQ